MKEDTTKLIVEFQRELLNLNEIRDIYRITSRVIKNIIGSGIVISSILNEDDQSLSIADYFGLKTNIDRINSIVGGNIVNRKFYIKDMTSEELASYRSGSFRILSDGLYALTTRKIPKKVCNILGGLLGIKNVYTIGFVYNKIHYGGIIILTNKDLELYSYEIEHIVSQASMIIQRIILEKKLKEAKEKAEESDRLKTVFLQNVSHEIRTPMNAIIGFSEIVKNVKDDNELQNKYLDIISKSSYQLLSIVNDILTVSMLETSQEELCISPLDLNSMIGELKSIFETKANAKNLTFKISGSLGVDDSLILTDGVKLRQIISNLLSNSIKHTEKGSIELGYAIIGSDLKIYVCDTGIGINEEYFEEIFKRFTQVDYSNAFMNDGMGLGLSISKSFVELMGGQMWVESVVGKGSTFLFTIPYNRAKKLTESKRVNTQNKYDALILVVDDVPINYSLIEELLSKTNVKLLYARDGKEAVDIFKSNKQISMIIMDLKMPVMDGYEATLKIRRINENIPIIAYTAYALPHELELAKKYGFSEYLTKPLKADDLFNILAKFLGTNTPLY